MMKEVSGRMKWPTWQQYLVIMSVAAALVVVAGVVLMLRSAEEMDDALDDEAVAHADAQPERKAASLPDEATVQRDENASSAPSADAGAVAKAHDATSAATASPDETKPHAGAESPARAQPAAVDAPSSEKADDKKANRENASGGGNTAAISPARSVPEQNASAPPSGVATANTEDWLKLDEHGEPCQVTLANGTVLKLDTYGDEYEGYDYRPPITLYDPKLQTLIDFKNVRGHGISVSHLRFDSKNDRMFWIWTNPPHRAGKILTADLNGQGIVNLATDMENIFGFAIDPRRNKMYWTERTALVDSVKSAGLDGSNIQQIVPGAYGVGIAVEPESGDVFYWTKEGTAKSINRVKADGSGDTEIIKDPFVVRSYAKQIIVEPTSHKLYWRCSDGSIRRANTMVRNLSLLSTPKAAVGTAAISLSIWSTRRFIGPRAALWNFAEPISMVHNENSC